MHERLINIKMSTIISNQAEAERFWNIIKDTSNEIKILLINMLSASILEKTNSVNPKMTSDKKTKEFIEKFAGAWKSDLSAEELISLIHENHSCKEPPIL